jgi:rare lipoprotein A
LESHDDDEGRIGVPEHPLTGSPGRLRYWRAAGLPAFRATMIVAVAALVASCAAVPSPVSHKPHGKEYFSERQYGPASPRIIVNGEVPKGGGRAMVGAPYRVAGKTYIPRDNPRYSAIGLASWYGSAFHGRLTANGEVYDVNGLTAAHPTLPLPSYARVTNLQNGRSLIVRVNDRGPFAADRIIDLSSRVADILDVKNEGTAKVKVDYVGPAQMDGLDQKMLLASYREPGGFYKRERAVPQDSVMVAAAPPLPRPRRLDIPAPRDDSLDGRLMAPAYAPSPGIDDPLAPLIMRASLATSYASDIELTDAQHAAASLAMGGKGPGLNAGQGRAPTPKLLIYAGQTSQAPVPHAIVQLGSFSDPRNAERLVADFSQFGTVQSLPQAVGARSFSVVRVVLADSVSPASVLAAAERSGLSGAFVICR